MHCEKCGAVLAGNSQFCVSCGAKVEGRPVVTTGQSYTPPPPPPDYGPSVQGSPPPPPAYGPVSQSPPPPPPGPGPAVQTTSYTPPQPYPSQSLHEARMQYERGPLSVGQYIGMFLLLAIPIVNIILLFVWSFGSTVNLNRKNFARASLILSIIFVIFWLIAGGLIMGSLESILSEFF